MVPNRLYQTWKSKHDLPENFAYWRQTFADCNPEFELLLFDDSDNRCFVQRYLPAFLEIYDSFPKEIFRADAIRPMYMFFEGGFYADMDFECLKPLQRYTQFENVIVGSMGVDPDFVDSIPNAMLASPRYEAFWLLYLREMANRASLADARGPEFVTGPVALRDSVKKYTEHPEESRKAIAQFIEQYQVSVTPDLIRYSDVHVLPGIEWYPLDWSDYFHQKFRTDLLARKRILSREEAKRIFRRSVAVTYWSHSWETPRRESVRKRSKAWIANRVKKVRKLMKRH